MPVVSGWEVQSALARSGAAVPVIMISGDDGPDNRERALRQGACAYLRKPVDDTALIEAIQGAIAKV